MTRAKQRAKAAAAKQRLQSQPAQHSHPAASAAPPRNAQEFLELFDESNFPFFPYPPNASQGKTSSQQAASTMVPISDRALSMLKRMLSKRAPQDQAPIITTDAQGNPTGAIDLVLGANDIPDFMKMIMSDPLLSSIPESKRRNAEEAMKAATNAALPTVNEILRRAGENPAPASVDLDPSKDMDNYAAFDESGIGIGFEAPTLQDIKEVLESITDSARLGILAAAAKNGKKASAAPSGSLPSLEELLKLPIFNNGALRSNPILAKQKQPAVPQPTHVQASEAFEYDDVSGEEEEGVSYVYDSEDEFDESEGDVVYEEGAYEDVLDVGPEMFLRPPDPSAPTAPPVTRPPLAEDPQRLDAAVNELFTWIKTIQWTYQQRELQRAQMLKANAAARAAPASAQR